MTSDQSDTPALHSLWAVMEQARYKTPPLYSLWAVMEGARQQPVVPALPEWISPSLDPIRDRLAQPATRRFNKAVGLTLFLHAVVIWILMSLCLPSAPKPPDIIVTAVIQKQLKPVTLFDEIALPVVEDPGTPQSDAVSLLQTAVKIQESATGHQELALGGGLGGFGGGPGTMFGGARRAQSIVFLIDRSGSMGGHRLKTVKKELIAAIAKLNETQSYEIIFYSNSVMRLLGDGVHLTAATPANLDTVKRQLKKVIATGGNNERAGFKAALALKPQLILFLTDGHFSIDVERDILQQNATQTRINTVLIDSENTHPVMQEIATETGGYFRTVQMTPLN